MRGSKAYPTKDQAVADGRLRAMAARTEHVIHNQDGTFGYRNSYGYDPQRTKG